ncbi:outer spore wall protein RRT8 [Trichoderma asperellum]|uniref:Outer spore wall protein RRT8 n=1 Tax=Trichoderma asperellum TaxID=101201 RepID=A0A6V8QPZ6_TRIAP|nr:outer spore wall protein RRT8 [Trichoderma asperellum]
MPESDHKLRNRVVDSISRRAENALTEDYGKARAMATDAVQSRAYLYPIKGIFYFIAHRSLWQPLLDRVVPYGTLTASVIGAMFVITYLPQLAVMALFNGPLAVYSTVLLTLNESSIIIHMISRTWLLQESLMDTFDGTLVARNATAVVQQGREVHAGSDPMKKLGKVFKKRFEKLSLTAMIRYVMYLPLNFIPVVGTAAFIFLHDSKYFQLKNWSDLQRAQWINTHSGAYASFGVVATLLEMIPVVSVFFSYTNTVGAALWAADIESQNNPMVKETAPKLRQAAADSFE